jgi:uncharacterized membrane protein YdjX (TVP38/TMEM64 family)
MTELSEAAATRVAPMRLWRLAALFFGLALLFGVPFVLWGDWFETVLHQDQLGAWFSSYRSFAWLIAIGLLVSDLVLPIPNTIVIAALGILYGPLLGGFVATVGTCLSGVLGYGLCRRLGRPLAIRLLGVDEMSRGELLFARSGGLIVAISRWLPILSEAISCMAGLSRMSLPTFLLALVCGAAPLCFIVAGMGYLGTDRPLLVLLLSGLLPIPVWLLVRTSVPPMGWTRTP